MQQVVAVAADVQVVGHSRMWSKGNLANSAQVDHRPTTVDNGDDSAMPSKASSVAKGKGRAISAAAATTPASNSKKQTSQEEQVDGVAGGEDSDDDEDSDDEEDDADVDESAMAKLMDMLGDVDPEELGFAPEDLEDDEDDKQQDDEDDEDVDSALEDEDLDAESVDDEEDEELDLGDDDQDAEIDTAKVSRPQDTANPKVKGPSVEQRRQNVRNKLVCTVDHVLTTLHSKFWKAY